MGTLDGANIEIMEEVGPENIFIFGLKAHEIEEMRRKGSYNPREHYDADPRVKRVMDTFRSNIFCQSEPGLFESFFNSLISTDEYFHLADLPSYIHAQEEAARQFRVPEVWRRKAILNIARIGKFSSDRSVSEYAREIWEIESF
jgi:starch phosphorylase